LSQQYHKCLVGSWHTKTCDHKVDTLIKIMKYINHSHGGCIGLQISPYIRSKNEINSFSFFLGDGLITNFLWELIIHEKSLNWRISWLFNECSHEISNIFRITIDTKWHNQSYLTTNSFLFRKLLIYNCVTNKRVMQI